MPASISLPSAIENATRCAEQAISLAPDQTSPLILRAQIDLEQNNPQEAYSRAQSALTIDPGNPEALLLVARALKAMDQPDKAIELLEKAIPELADPLPLNLEYIHLIHQAKGVKPALQVASELSNQYPNDPQVLSAAGKNPGGRRSDQRRDPGGTTGITQFIQP